MTRSANNRTIQFATSSAKLYQVDMVTYKVRTTRADANAAGGKSEAVWIVRAHDEAAAAQLVAGSHPEIVDGGAHLDHEAVSLGVGDNDAKLL